MPISASLASHGPFTAHPITATEKGARIFEQQQHDVVLTDLYEWPWMGQTAADVPRKPCLKILDELFVYANGNVTICCWDVHERAVIGNVNEQSVLEIWKSYAAECLRAVLNDGRRDLIQLCSRCNAYRDYDFSGFETG